MGPLHVPLELGEGEVGEPQRWEPVSPSEPRLTGRRHSPQAKGRTNTYCLLRLRDEGYNGIGHLGWCLSLQTMAGAQLRPAVWCMSDTARA